MISPIANWRAVLRYAWSVRLIVLAIIFSGLEVAVPLLGGVLPIAPGMFAGLCFLTSVAAGIARFVAQARVTDAPDPNWTNGDEE